MLKKIRLLSSFALCLAVTSVAVADNWSRFRGPNGTGVAVDKDVPVQFSAKEGLIWKVALPGVGNSSPIVWGKRIFMQAATKDQKERQLLCLDADTGKTLWTRTMPGVFVKFRQESSPASSTPATDGERVFVAFWDGNDILMHAYDFDGKEIWKRNLGPFVSQHGAGASPVAYGGLLYYAKDQDDSSNLFALDTRTGEVVWKQPRPYFRACYSPPFMLEKPNMPPELIVTSSKGITSYNPQLGEQNWNWEWKFTAKMPLRTIVAPAFANNMLFACSGDGGGDRHMVAVKLEGNGAGTKPSLVWENKKDFPYVPNPLVRGDNVYFVNDQGVAGCYEGATGKRIWFERLEGATFLASPVMIDGKVYAASEEGDVFVFAAEPKFQLLAKNPLGERFRASPAVADNRLYLRGQQHLFCIGKAQSK
jgi:outer membrane protein assembly factor BamB